MPPFISFSCLRRSHSGFFDGLSDAEDADLPGDTLLSMVNSLFQPGLVNQHQSQQQQQQQQQQQPKEQNTFASEQYQLAAASSNDNSNNNDDTRAAVSTQNSLTEE